LFSKLKAVSQQGSRQSSIHWLRRINLSVRRFLSAVQQKSSIVAKSAALDPGTIRITGYRSRRRRDTEGNLEDIEVRCSYAFCDFLLIFAESREILRENTP
jgi:hypothetical protein